MSMLTAIPRGLTTVWDNYLDTFRTQKITLTIVFSTSSPRRRTNVRNKKYRDGLSAFIVDCLADLPAYILDFLMRL